jgi:hypothetical protein
MSAIADHILTLPPWLALLIVFALPLAGNWRHVEQLASRIGLGALAVTVAVIAGTVLLRRRRNRGAPTSRVLEQTSRGESRDVAA